MLVKSKYVNDVGKLLQLLGNFVTQTPNGATPLDATGDFCPPDSLAYSPQMKIVGAAALCGV